MKAFKEYYQSKAKSIAELLATRAGSKPTNIHIKEQNILFLS